MLLTHSESDFRKLWFGQTVSEVGSWISITALPVAAALLLEATPAQMGILSAASSGSTLLVGLFAGVLVDRIRRRPILIWSDILRALLLGTVPAAALFHVLTFGHLLLVAALTGAVTVFFDVAYESYLPSLIERAELARGNRLLGMSSAAAEVAGPLLAGVLIQAVTAPLAIALDAASFLFSAGAVIGIRTRENDARSAPHADWREEALAGARVIRKNPLLYALALRSIMAYLCGGMMAALYILYAVRTLRMSTPALGLTIALGGAGSFAGAYFAERISKRLGAGRAFLLSAIAGGLINLLIPLSTLVPSFAVALLGASQLFGDGIWSVYGVNEITLRQRVVPAELLGRVNAAMQIVSQGLLPIGALAGGLLASRFGIPATLWVSTVGVLASSLWLFAARSLNDQ